MNITIKPNSNYWIANNVGSIILFILALILLGSDIPVIRWDKFGYYGLYLH